MTTTAPPFRVGLGYDIHAFEDGRPLILGGVAIPHARGLKGHSDADVLCHAIADAILGAAGLKDIGHFFPNDDASIKGIDSRKIVARAVEAAHASGYQIANIDATLIAEAPKVAPHLDAMKDCLSECLGIPVAAVGLKATTNEGLGSLGRAEGIAAHAVCLLWRST